MHINVNQDRDNDFDDEDIEPPPVSEKPTLTNSTTNSSSKSDVTQLKVNSLNDKFSLFQNRIETLQSESFDRFQTIQSQEKEIQNLKRQLDLIRQENAQKQKASVVDQVEISFLLLLTFFSQEELLSQLDTLKKSNDPELAKTLEKLKERVKKLKQESAEKDKQIVFFKEEVEKLRRQLDIYQQANDDDLKVIMKEN